MGLCDLKSENKISKSKLELKKHLILQNCIEIAKFSRHKKCFVELYHVCNIIHFTVFQSKDGQCFTLHVKELTVNLPPLINKNSQSFICRVSMQCNICISPLEIVICISHRTFPISCIPRSEQQLS